MSNCKRLRPLTLVAAYLIFGCSCAPQSTDAPPREILQHLLVLRAYQPDGSLESTGCGVVFSQTDEHTYVVTARHVVTRLVEVTDLPLPFPLHVERRLEARTCVDGVEHRGEVIWDNPRLDAALVRFPPFARPPIYYLLDDPEWGTPAWSIGYFVPHNIPLIYPGMYQGRDGVDQVFSTHIHRGFSGGFVVTKNGSRWTASGLSSKMGIQGDGTRLHHITFAVPFYEIAAAIDAAFGISEAKEPEPAGPPLDIDILREF